ncbi:MAG: agmatinase [Euryarchaeota archaeon RBG_16_62_10]|nr:MAG: agmatinase [Euryarchaeota archaeon RBG_16_62_10]
MPIRGMLRFTDASFSFEDSEFVIVGVPFDRTTTYRSGTRFAPTAIREVTHVFEKENFEHGTTFEDIPVHDAGDLYEEGTVDDMVMAIEEEARRIVLAKKFPLFMGGEHSISPPVVKAFGDISVITIDAHLDFRDEYQGLRNSHACAHRRIVDHVGKGNAFAFGVRSISSDEDLSEALYADSFRIHKEGCEKVFEEMLSKLKRKPVYLSLDIDGIDPAYAPGTGTPEPFGITPWDVRYIINRLGDRLVGFDVVEVCPPYDNGNTSILAARMMREVMAVKWKAMHAKKGR